MPQKESAKERKEREKAEALALAQFGERQQFEMGEEKARQAVETRESIERLEAINEFYAHMIRPSSRLMVRFTEYQEVRQIMTTDGIAKSKQVKDLTHQYLHMKNTYTALQLELVHLRSECRQLSQQIRKEQTDVFTHVNVELRQCVDRIEDDILNHRKDVAQCGVHLHRTLESARLRSAGLAHTAMQMSERITAVLEAQQSMHTRIPVRIRRILFELEKDDLVRLFDTLSFEDNVLHALLYRFPPPHDDPFTQRSPTRLGPRDEHGN